MQVHTSQASVPASTTLDPVIAAVAGKFYSYRADFSSDRPLAYFMDCKANKSRSLVDVDQIDREVPLELVFLFGDTVRACSPNAPASVELLGDLVITSELNQTKLALANMDEQTFNAIRKEKHGHTLAQVCRDIVAQNHEDVVTLSAGMILAVTTESDKYGLLLVKELMPTSVKVDACHILL